MWGRLAVMVHPHGWAILLNLSSVVPEEKLLSDGMLVEAREASEEDLLVVHTRRYLNELKVQYRDLWAVAGSSGRRRSSSALGGPTPVPSTGEVLKMKRGR